jgi:hypothetical protein
MNGTIELHPHFIDLHSDVVALNLEFAPRLLELSLPVLTFYLAELAPSTVCEL